MTALPKMYDFLNNENAPRVLVEALRLYGTTETPGEADNKTILEWAKELELKAYNHDSIAWCGLFAAIVIKRAGYEPVKEPLWADNWRKFGTKIETAHVGLFDILTFKREGGNHVGFYIGEDHTHYHVFGGNQGDKVSIVRIAKSRLTGIRRCPWKHGEPANVRRIWLSANGVVSKNEA